MPRKNAGNPGLLHTRLRQPVPGAYKLVAVMSRQHLLVAGLVAALLPACKLGKSDDPDRPLPAPEPPAPDAGPPLEPGAPVEAPRRTTPREKPRTETDTAAPSQPAPAETAAPTAGATTPPPAGTTSPDAGATAPAPSAAPALPDLQDKAIACMNKCQASLSGCMSKPVALDGGMPDMSAMSECKKAFDDCRAACSP